MARLRTLRPKLKTLEQGRKAATTKEVRMTGRRLQDRRLRIWAEDPTCAVCGRVTDFPHGFELDHKVPLFKGGQDIDENCQVLCVEYDEMGRKAGCHAAKSAEDAKG